MRVNFILKKIILLLIIVLFNSCTNTYNRSFLELANAFEKWYFVHYPHDSVTINPYNYYIKTKLGNINFINEHILDLKRFKLELNQINKTQLYNNNLLRYNSIIYTIESLLYKELFIKDSTINPQYYTNYIYSHLLKLLATDNIDNITKSLYANNTLELIPAQVKRAKKSLIFSNGYFIDKAIKDIAKINILFEDILLYTNPNDIMLVKIESNLNIASRSIFDFQVWLNTKLEKKDFIDDAIKSEYIEKRNNLEKIYKYKNIIKSLTRSVNNIQNKIFEISLPIYLLDNDEPIWVDREDTLSIVKYVINKKYVNKKIVKDIESRIIQSSDSYDTINAFAVSKSIYNTLDFVNIKYPFFEELPNYTDNAMIINKDSDISVLIGNMNSYLPQTHLNYFIIESLIPELLYFKYSNKKTLRINNDINKYCWGKIIGKVFIDSGFKELDSDFELLHNMKLLQDFVYLLIKDKYANNEISEKQAIYILSKDAFYSKDESENVWQDILYKNDFNLEYYASYILINYLFDQNCTLHNYMNPEQFIKKMISSGFIQAYNYKTILN